MYFRNYGLQKTWLDQYSKSSFSDDPSKSNMVLTPKLSSNLTESSFSIFNDHWESNCLTKSLCYKYPKSQNCFLTN